MWTMAPASASNTSRRPVRGFRAVDRVEVEAQPFVQSLERGAVAAAETGFEAGHGGFLLGALLGRAAHAGVQVVHHPVAGDGHVAEEGLAVDEGDTRLAVEAA